MSDRTCAGCEYFDRHYGDCHNSLSPRFQTKPEWTCDHWVQDSTAESSADEQDGAEREARSEPETPRCGHDGDWY